MLKKKPAEEVKVEKTESTAKKLTLTVDSELIDKAFAFLRSEGYRVHMPVNENDVITEITIKKT